MRYAVNLARHSKHELRIWNQPNSTGHAPRALDLGIVLLVYCGIDVSGQ
jgi:hypothetical protein